jgi:membrane protease YdiL (CAAX protease family)
MDDSPMDDSSSQPTVPPTSQPWPPWTAPAALVCGLVLAAVGGLLVDIPALALGVSVTASHVPPGLEIADTAVQDVAFVIAAVFFAQLGGRGVSAWQFGLRPTRLWPALRLVMLTLVGFLLFSLIWSAVFHAPREKLLEQLGTGESTILLLLSAALTCVVAPVCEEFLFRGFVFTALRNWRGVWPAAVISGVVFGGVHAGSAPAADLVPLAALGFFLCLLYHYTGSLYPCIAAHSLNNSLAFGSLENWGWQIPVLMLAALALIGLLVLALIRAGLISAEAPIITADRLAVGQGG